MDIIWYRNASKSEVIGHCGGDVKTNDHAEPTKVERYNKRPIVTQMYFGRSHLFLKSFYFDYNRLR